MTWICSTIIGDWHVLVVIVLGSNDNEITKETKHMVQALPLFYSRVSHQKIQQILSEVWNVFHCEEVKLHNMKKTVLSYTCVTGKVQKLIHCPLCLQWFNTFSLSCPKCSNNDTRITESNSFRLSFHLQTMSRQSCKRE